VIEFAPTVKGLHAINLRENPDAAYLLVNDTDLAFHSPVQTVCRNYEGFTKKQVQRATLACRIMGMIGAPTEHEYQGLVHQNVLQDCPIKPSDIANAHKNFGPDQANIRGKTVRRKPVHISTKIVEIPQHILSNQQHVTLSADAMFVNEVPFLVSVSRTRTPRVLQIPPPFTYSRVSMQNRRLPSHLDDYHVFTTVTEECHQPRERPYHTAGGTDIRDEECMAYLCHFVMVHTATSLALAQQGQPTKKQYGLKTGLKWFGSRSDTAVTKELSQLHTLNCFYPCDPSSLTRDDRRNALSFLMFLTEKRSGEVKARACANGSV